MVSCLSDAFYGHIHQPRRMSYSYVIVEMSKCSSIILSGVGSLWLFLARCEVLGHRNPWSAWGPHSHQSPLDPDPGSMWLKLYPPPLCPYLAEQRAGSSLAHLALWRSHVRALISRGGYARC